MLSPVKQRLINAGLLVTGNRGQLIPARDPDTISLGDVFAAVRDRSEADIFQINRWPAKVNKVFAEVDALTSSPLNEKSLYGLLDEEPQGLGES